jgi:hypothetical protein
LTGPFPVAMTWLCLTGLAAYFWPLPSWALPTLTLMVSAAAVSIDFINMGANLAGYFGSHFTAWLRNHHATEATCLLVLADCYFAGTVLINLVNVSPKPGASSTNATASLQQLKTGIPAPAASSLTPNPIQVRPRGKSREMAALLIM